MVGYNNYDWGLSKWICQQDKELAEYDAVVRNAEFHYDECIAIAKKVAPEFYNANGEGYYESPEEFLADAECWPEWLVDECVDPDVKQAMQFWIERDEYFAKPEWVLTQV